MTFPVVQSRATGRTTAVNATSHVITMPPGTVVGDLIVVVFSCDGNYTCTASAGWTKVGQSSNSATVTGAIFTRHATGTDALTISTSASTQSSHVSLRISGTTGSSGVVATTANGSSTNSNPPSLTMSTVQDYLWIATRSGDSTVLATAVPAGYGNWQSIAAAGTNGASTDTAELAANGISQDPGTWTSLTEQWVSWTIAVTPGALLPTTARFGSVQLDTSVSGMNPSMRFGSVRLDTAIRISPIMQFGSVQLDVAYPYVAIIPTGPTVSVWNGTAEIAASVFVWDGTAEIASSVEVVP